MAIRQVLTNDRGDDRQHIRAQARQALARLSTRFVQENNLFVATLKVDAAPNMLQSLMEALKSVGYWRNTVNADKAKDATITMGSRPGASLVIRTAKTGKKSTVRFEIEGLT